MKKILLQIFILMSSGYIIGQLVLLASLVFWIFSWGDPGALLDIGVYTLVFTFITQAVLWFTIMKLYERDHR